MKIYIVCLKDSGCPYPLGYAGKTASYTTQKEAEDAAKAITTSDTIYCEHHGGLFVDTLEGSESLLSAVGFAW